MQLNILYGFYLYLHMQCACGRPSRKAIECKFPETGFFGLAEVQLIRIVWPKTVWLVKMSSYRYYY